MIQPTALSPASTMPVSVTTNKDTRPVSIRTAQENEIDQLNNTPNAKRLYNAKIAGGVVGAVIPLALAVAGVSKTRNFLQEATKFRTVLQAGIAAAGIYFAVPMAQAGAAVSKALTVFVSTRGKGKVE